MDAVVIAALAGIGGTAIGAFGSAFLLGRRYEGLLANDKTLFQAHEALNNRVKAVEEDLIKHKEREEIMVDRLEKLIGDATRETAKLSENVAVLNTNLQARPAQKDVQNIVERLASIESKLDIERSK